MTHRNRQHDRHPNAPDGYYDERRSDQGGNQIARRNEDQPMAALSLPSGPLTQIAEVKSILLEAAKHANVLAPVTELHSLPMDHQIVFAALYFDPDKPWQKTKTGRQTSNGVWYATEGGKVALHRTALDQLAEAAGVDTVDVQTTQPEPLLWKSKVRVRRKQIDGTQRHETRGKEVDLRDGLSPSEIERQLQGLDYKSYEARQLRARKNQIIHAAQACETKAYNRAVRAILGIQPAYTKDEARLPFVVPRLVWSPPNTAAMSQLIAMRELGMTASLYGPGQQATEPPALSVDPPADPNQFDLDDDTDDAVYVEPEAPVFEHDRQGRGAPPCEVCGAQLSDMVADAHLREFDMPLCMDHAAAARERRAARNR